MNKIALVEPILNRFSSIKIRLLGAASAILLIGIPASNASAQAESPFPSSQVDGATGGADAAPSNGAEDTQPKITVSRSACKALVRHVPDEDVAYKPGVDVRGNAVAPADLNGGSNILRSLPKEIEFPVTLDFFEYSGIDAPDGMSGEQSIGKITYRNGRVYFNDQPIGNDAVNDDLIAACREAGFR